MLYIQIFEDYCYLYHSLTTLQPVSLIEINSMYAGFTCIREVGCKVVDKNDIQIASPSLEVFSKASQKGFDQFFLIKL